MPKGNPNPSHKFEKGHKYYPKSQNDYIVACKAAANGTLDKIISIGNNPKHKDQIKALTWLAEMGYGKATQRIEGTGDESKAIIHRTLLDNGANLQRHIIDSETNDTV